MRTIECFYRRGALVQAAHPLLSTLHLIVRALFYYFGAFDVISSRAREFSTRYCFVYIE